MELLYVTESKLKVILTKEDLEVFDLRCEELDYSNTETKRMFWDILGRAKRTLGFDTDGDRVLLQLYPARGGGCEMYVTRLGPAHGTPPHTEEAEGLSSKALLHYKPSHLLPPGSGKPGAFAFERMEYLLSVCHRLCDIGYVGASEAYAGDNGRYYLFLEGLDPTEYLPLDEYSFLSEYGSRENPKELRGFLGEHGRTICDKDAVGRLGIL